MRDTSTHPGEARARAAGVSAMATSPNFVSSHMTRARSHLRHFQTPAWPGVPKLRQGARGLGVR